MLNDTNRIILTINEELRKGVINRTHDDIMPEYIEKQETAYDDDIITGIQNKSKTTTKG